VQGVALLARPKLNDRLLCQVPDQPLEYLASQPLPGHLPSAEENRRLHLVAFAEKSQHVVFFGLVVVVVNVDTELYFLHHNLVLVLLGLTLALFLLIQVLSIIHDAADRGLRGGRNFDQIQVFFAGYFERFERRHNAKLVTFVVNHANFADTNTLVCADKTLIDTGLQRDVLL